MKQIIKYIVRELNLEMPKNMNELKEEIIDATSMIASMGLVYIALMILG